MSKKNSTALSLKQILNKDKNISDIYLKFKKNISGIVKSNNFTVAVSGGSDSLALTALSKLYALEKKSKAFFVLIDHGLRKNSKKEAQIVKTLLKKNAIPLHIITNQKPINNNIQSLARKIRYDLILNFCKKKKIKYIVTAHHSDDQIETFFIRLSRGSGVQGLSSMSKIVSLNSKIKLLRPLLELKKKELVYISKKIFKKSIKDPSNSDNKYLRTRIRKLKKELEKTGIHHDQILKSISNLASTRDTLNIYFKKVISLCVKKRSGKNLINLDRLFLEPQEIQIKVISHTIKSSSKTYYPPRAKKVSNLLKRLKDSRFAFKATLGGCFLQKFDNFLVVTNSKQLN
jgi:tRNA(Ile)-lysidine synthase